MISLVYIFLTAANKQRKNYGTSTEKRKKETTFYRRDRVFEVASLYGMMRRRFITW